MLQTITRLRYSGRSLKIFRRSRSTLRRLPYRIQRAKANELLAPSTNFFEVNTSIPSTELVIYDQDPVTKCFIPFHSADFREIASQYTANYGIDKIEYRWVTSYDLNTKKTTTKLQPQIVTKWRTIQGIMSMTDYPLGTKQTQIYAGFTYPQELMERTLTIDNLEGLQPVVDDSLYQAHEMNIAFALEKMNSRLYDLEIARITKYIYKLYSADHVKITSLNMNWETAKINLISYFIPAYIYQTNLYGLIKYKIINGYTGNMGTNRIYSPAKISGLGVALTQLLFCGNFVLSGIILPPDINVISTILIASIVGGLTQARNYWTNFKYQEQCRNDQKLNHEYIETSGDRERRNFAHSGEKFPNDQLKLLGLPIDVIPSLEDLKHAYHIQLKKWHPDIHPNKILAEAMTKQVLEAYSQLQKFVNDTL